MPPWQKELIAQITQYLNHEVGPFYETHDEPTLHELSRQASEVTFLFDHYVYNFAQSGSDWADHYFVRGTATLAGERLVKSMFTLVRRIQLTEWEADQYSPSRITSLMLSGRDDEVSDAIDDERMKSDGPEPAY